MEFLIAYIIWCLFGVYTMYRWLKYGDLKYKEHLDGNDIAFILFIVFIGGACEFVLFLIMGDLGFHWEHKPIKIRNPFYKNIFSKGE